MKIYIEYNKQRIEIKVNGTEKIKEIFHKANLKREEKSIVYKNKILNGEESINDNKIEHESIVYIIKNKINLSLQLFDKVVYIFQLSPMNTIKKEIGQEFNNYYDSLVYNGIKLIGDQTLFECHIHDDIIIYIQDTTVFINNQQKPNKKKKKRCSLTKCHEKICKMIGHCSYCQLNYCSRHRLPEAHVCVNLHGCKQVAHERNSEKLLNEQCVASKLSFL